MKQPIAEVRRLARKLHHCPDGYEGPCWGANPEDENEALRILSGFEDVTHDWVRCTTCRRRVVRGEEHLHDCPKAPRGEEGTH